MAVGYRCAGTPLVDATGGRGGMAMPSYLRDMSFIQSDCCEDSAMNFSFICWAAAAKAAGSTGGGFGGPPGAAGWTGTGGACCSMGRPILEPKGRSCSAFTGGGGCRF